MITRRELLKRIVQTAAALPLVKLAEPAPKYEFSETGHLKLSPEQYAATTMYWPGAVKVEWAGGGEIFTTIDKLPLGSMTYTNTDGKVYIIGEDDKLHYIGEAA